MLHPVSRVVAVRRAGRTPSTAGSKLGATPSSRYFALIHARDDFFARTCLRVRRARPGPDLPAAGLPVLDRPTRCWSRTASRRSARRSSCSISSRRPTPTASPTRTTPARRRDGWIAARGGRLTPSRKLVNAWRSVLGDSDADTRLDQRRQLPAGRQRRPDRQRRQRDRRRLRPDARDGHASAARCRRRSSLTLGAPADVRRVHARRRPQLRREHDRHRHLHRRRRGAVGQPIPSTERHRPAGQRRVLRSPSRCRRGPQRRRHRQGVRGAGHDAARAARPTRGPVEQRRGHDRVPPAHRRDPGAAHRRVQQDADVHAVDHDAMTPDRGSRKLPNAREPSV